MSARSPGAALRDHLVAVQQVIGCVTPSVARIGAPGGQSPTRALSLGTPVRIQGTHPAVEIAVVQYLVAVSERKSQGWSTRAVGYHYSMLRAGTREELLVFHWHPERESHVQAPHLHLGPSLLQVLGTKRSAHLPTGSIRVADFVELLLRDFNAKPERQDWQAVLEDAEV